MNLPNKLTILRIILSFVCIGFILQDNLSSLIIALILFGLASLTDFFDGYIARKRNLISDLGKILDPIADKILIIGVFCAFIELGIVNSWMVILIMLREFIITGLRLYGLNKGIVLEAKKFGKHKTVSQVVGIFVIFFAVIFSKTIPESAIVPFLYEKIIPLIMGYIVIITVFSGVYYFWVNRKAIRTF
ncbi:MAG: CDP-diacylglycerol--glycerol-3-phosphate 3-phosphatidyltransferase [Candidatus Omnitrophica bacterium]|nr:CDP-diacylglycerol--glycerol-3-phosphate 3-phosphatidyltransferase [Candidatus Omnitrophota bacterium]